VLGVREIDPGVRVDESVMRLGDAQWSPATQDSRRFTFDECNLVLFRAVEVDDLALGLRHHLARDDDEVAVFERDPRGEKRFEEHSDEIITVMHHGDRREGDDAQFVHASTAALSRRALSRSAMIVVVTTTWTSRLRTSSTRAASASSMIHVPTNPLWKSTTPR